jgi:hypothetical protein
MEKKVKRDVCAAVGHNFVESSLGSDDKSKVVYIFCTKCGELKPLRGEN